MANETVNVSINGRAAFAFTPRQQTILDSFDYHRPSREQGFRIERNRLAFKVCAIAVIENCPDGPDQTAALRQLHEAMMTANKAIACEPGTERVEALGGAPGDECPRPPPGWRCSRGAGHTGPCAASPEARGDAPVRSLDDPNPGV